MGVSKQDRGDRPLAFPTWIPPKVGIPQVRPFAARANGAAFHTVGLLRRTRRRVDKETFAVNSLSPLAETPPTSVSIHQVSKSYSNGRAQVEALRGVSLDVPRGSFTAIMGPSGSGKSTLLNCAAGLDASSAGRIVVGGTDISAMSRDALTTFRRRHVGFIFQEYNLLPHLSIAENLKLPWWLDNHEPDLERITALLEDVGLAGMADRLPTELSGGQSQRVAIARALTMTPDVVFADEPTGALDSHTGHQILTLLRRAVDERRQTLVLVTHDARVASVADSVVFLADGRIVDHLAQPSIDTISSRILELAR